MLQIPIFIPSRSRAFRLHQSIIPKIPKELDNKVLLVIPVGQGNSYYSASAVGFHIVSSNESGDGTHSTTFNNSITDSLIFDFKM